MRVADRAMKPGTPSRPSCSTPRKRSELTDMLGGRTAARDGEAAPDGAVRETRRAGLYTKAVDELNSPAGILTVAGDRHVLHARSLPVRAHRGGLFNGLIWPKTG